MAETIAHYIREQRELQRVPQKMLAEGLGITPQYLCDLESGRREVTPALVPLLARELEVGADYLYYLIGRFPADLVGGDADEETVRAAFAELRQRLAA